MVKCKTCEIEIYFNDINITDNRCIGMIHNDEPYCVPCHEIIIFMDDKPKKERTKPTDSKIISQKSFSKTIYCCIKCSNILTSREPTCLKCNWTHPLLRRPQKKSKKKKKKKTSKKIK